MNSVHPSLWDIINSGNNSKVARKSSSRVFGLLSDSNHKIQYLTSLSLLSCHGRDWESLSNKDYDRNYQEQFHGGRGFELFLCEALILSRLPGFHFNTSKEIDEGYKVDLVSRIPYIGQSPLSGKTRLRTFSIGTQLTLMQLPENIDDLDYREEQSLYLNEKFQKVDFANQCFHSLIGRKDVKKAFGKLSLPDIMCFISVNGDLRKTFLHSNFGYATFKKWEKKDYPDTGVIGECNKNIRNKILNVAQFISDTQQFIFSNVFLKDPAVLKNRSCNFEINETCKYQFDGDTQQLDCYLFDDDKKHILVKVTYMFRGEDIKKLQSKRRNTDQSMKKKIGK